MPKLLRSTSTVPPRGFRFIQPETGVLLEAPNWQELRRRVANHRNANNLPIGTDFDTELQDWICRHIDDADYHCYEQGRNPGVPSAPTSSTGTGWDGSAKWRELHIYALTHRPNPHERAAWLKNWSESIPCGDCKKEGRKYIKSHPLPVAASPEEFFSWSVQFHNFVSSKLGKPQLTVEEAKAIWTR